MGDGPGPSRLARVGLLSVFLTLLGAVAPPSVWTAHAAAALTVRNISWGVIGLDSNGVNTGPNIFPLAGRVCNTGDVPATSVVVTVVWDTANANIGLIGNNSETFPTLVNGSCVDAYFNVQITRTTAAYNTTRGYHLTATASGLGTVSTPTPRELFVEKLVSQNRNSVTSITGPSTVYVGGTYTFQVASGTATGGYGQLNDFLDFPNVIFQLTSVASTYSVPAGATNTSVYADGCGWDANPTDPTYLSCVNNATFPAQYGGNVGGSTINTTYTVKILSAGSATLTTLINDFSGGSFHYNSDYGAGVNSLTVTAVNPPDMTVGVASGTFIQGQTGASYTITATNSGASSTSAAVSVVDALPAGLTATAIAGTGWTCTLATLTCTRSDVLAAGASYPVITVTVNVSSSAGSPLTNTATVSGGGEVDTTNDTGSVSTTVTPFTAAAASNDTATTSAGTALTVAAPGVMSNDSGSGITVTAHTAPTHGTLTIASDGSYTYTPTAAYSGSDSFSYTITDSKGGTSTATVTIGVTPRAVADAYNATTGVALNVAASGVLNNDVGTGLTVKSVVTPPTHGTLTLNSNGSFTYTAIGGFTGTDSFTYNDVDAAAQTSNTATVTLTVVAPIAANNDTGTTVAGTPLTVSPPGVLGNDTGTGITVTAYTQPGHGTVTVGATGGYTYTPAAGYSGSDSFTYTITDSIGRTATATVSLSVSPVAAADTYSGVAGTTLTVAAASGVLVNDTGTGLSAAVVAGPAHGSLTFNANGSFTYTPSAGYSGPDTFTYRDTDSSSLASNTATVTITVGPVAVSDTYSTAAGSTLTVASPGVLANDLGTGLQSSVVGGPAHGTLTLNANGSFTYTPSAGYSGPDAFTYRDQDGNGSFSAAATVTLHVTPVAVADSYSVPASTTLSVAAASGTLVNDLGTGLSATQVTSPAHGTLTLNADGSFTYIPVNGFSGGDSFTYKVTDGAAQTSPPATVSITVTPVAANDAFTLDANTTLTTNAAAGVLANDSGTGLTAALVAAPAHGAVTLNADGSFTYTPAAAYVGADSFTYRDTDSATHLSNIATVSLTVVTGPTANADSGTVIAGTALVVAAPGVLGNDVGSGLSVTAHTSPSHGTVTINANGSYTYTPAAGYSGPDAFTYTVTDNLGGTASATVSLTVTPKAVGDTYTTGFQTTLTTAAPGVLGNDLGSSLSAAVLAAPAHGAVTLNTNGSFSYTPAGGFAGTDSFTYTATDASAQTSTATVTVNVGLPAPPVATNKAGTTAANTTLTVAAPGLLNGDSGYSITVTGHGAATHGTVTTNANGSYTYTPAAGFSGSDSFTYTISDAFAQTSTATVTVAVTPVAVADSYSTPFQTALSVSAPGVLANDAGSSLSASPVTGPSHGTLTLNANGSFTYTPAAGFAGTDTFTYTATDASAQTSTATVTLSVALPAAPVATNKTATTAANTTLSVPAPGLLSGDSGFLITVTGHGAAAHGSVSTNANGSYTYTPAAGYSGGDSFTYTITDGFGQTSTATDTITVTPVAVPDSYSTAFQTALTVPAPGVLGNDAGSGLNASLGAGPAHGTVTLNADGSFTYTPGAGFAGADSFTYRATDASAQTSTATVSLTVGLPAPPTAKNQSATVGANATLSVPAPGLLTGDTGYAIAVTGNTAPSNGTVSVNADGSYIYSPFTNFVGTDSFVYTITDGFSRSASATVTITVTPPPAPVAVNHTATVAAGAVLTVASPGLLSGDTGNGITVTSHSSPSHGSVSTNANGSYTYTPVAGFSGSDSFTYTITDPFGQSSTATDTITVTPVAVADSYSTPFQTALSVSAPGVLGNDLGTGLTASVLAGPSHGTLTPNVNGSFTYTPAAGFAGTDTFTYTATDASAQTSTATVTITVALPAAPVATNKTGTTAANTTLTVAAPGLLGGDSGYSITVTGHGAAAHGSVSTNANGSYTYTPAAGYSGSDSFTYTITDGFGQTSTATDTLTVTPVAVADSYSTPFQAALSIAAPGVLGNDTGTGLGASLVTGPTHGTLGLSADGSFTYTPAAGYAGTDTFIYRATDSSAQTSTATVTITVALPAAPVATNKIGTTPANTTLTVAAPGLLSGDTGYAVTVTANSSPANGSLSVNSDGSYTYAPFVDFVGTDTFTYTITDGFGRTSSAAVTITVTPPPAPVANPQAATTPANTTLSVAAPGLLAGDTGNGITVLGNGPAVHGVASTNPDGSYTYSPASGYSGTDSFTYTIVDPFGQTSTSTATMTVTPVAVADTYATPFETPLGVAAPGVLGNDVGSGLSAAVATSPAHGTVVLDADGSFVYTPDAGFAGADSFTYAATDVGSQSATATVTITTAFPPAPVAIDHAVTTVTGVPVTIAAPGLLSGDSGTGLTVASTESPEDGSVTSSSDGAYTYTPNGGFSGVDNFPYTVSDSAGQSATATVTVTVDPSAHPVTGTLVAGSGGLAFTPPPPAGTGPFTWSLVGASLPPSSVGTVTINGTTGQMIFVPAHGFSGPVPAFDYTVTGSGGTSTTAVVTLLVIPAAAPYSTTITNTGSAVSFSLPAPDGGAPFTWQLVPSTLPPASVATVTVNATTGVVTVLPGPAFTGQVEGIEYTVTDASGTQSAPALIVVEVLGISTTVPVPDTGAVSAVPEPDGLVLVLAGAGALLVRRRRSRAR